MKRYKLLLITVITIVTALAFSVNVMAEENAGETYATTSPTTYAIYATTAPTYATTAQTYATYATTAATYATYATTAPTYATYATTAATYATTVTTASTSATTTAPTTKETTMATDPYDTTSAADTANYTTYTIAPLKLSLNLPVNMTVITRDTQSTDSYFSSGKNDYNKVMKNFTDNNIYLEGFSNDGTQTITVSMTSDSNSQKVHNYKLLTNDQLDEVKATYEAEDSCNSCTIDDYEDVMYYDLIVTGGTKKAPTYLAQSNTVVNGMNINFTLISNDGEISDSDRTMMQNILAGAKFTITGENGTTSEMSTFIWVLIIILVVLVLCGVGAFFLYKKRKEMAYKAAKSGLYVTDKSEIPVDRRAAKPRIGNDTFGDEEFFDGVQGLSTPKNIHFEQEKKSRPKKHTNTDANSNDEDFFDDFIGLDESEKRTPNHQRRPQTQKKKQGVLKRIDNFRRNVKAMKHKDGGRRF